MIVLQVTSRYNLINFKVTWLSGVLQKLLLIIACDETKAVLLTR